MSVGHQERSDTGNVSGGGLSRDGFLREPKLGLIDSMVTAKEDRSFQREIVFVPVAINYDRVLEDRNLIGELKPKSVNLRSLKCWDGS